MAKVAANVLITCAGRRVELTRAFISALRGMGGGGRVFAADCRRDAPALSVADGAVILPPLSFADNYLLSLEAAIKDNGVSLVVPTIDTELALLAEWREWLEERTGAKILVSSPECVAVCADKGRTAAFFAEHGIPCPKTWRGRAETDAGHPQLPLVVKPADGSSSQNVFVARTERELDFFLDYVPNAIAQSRLEGREYTVDALLGFDSGFVAAVPRQRLAVRAGEILKGRIDLSQPVIDASRRLLGALGAIGAIGPMTLQGFLCPDGIFRFTEINPRFGGGLPMTVAAGADFPAWVCRAAAGLAPSDLSRIRDGAVFSRFDSMVDVTEFAHWTPEHG